MPDDHMINRIILNDSIILDDCDCGYTNRSLWCYLKGYTFSEAFQLFSSPDHFQKVVYEYGYPYYYKRIIYTGFTAITALEQRDFTVDVRLEGIDISVKEETIVNEIRDVTSDGSEK